MNDKKERLAMTHEYELLLIGDRVAKQWMNCSIHYRSRIIVLNLPAI